jgi:large subunit ribosomal protein L31
MKKDIHPEYVVAQVTCTCGNSFTTRSTAPSAAIRADVCSNCHPFYTGKQKILDTGGRVARFEKRYAQSEKNKSGKKESAAPETSPGATEATESSGIAP